MAKPREKIEVYTRSIARRWGKEIELRGDAIVVSPYLTSPTAERILLRSDASGDGKVVVLTTFSAECFAAGASHLGALKKLVNGGCVLLHVDNLHAKIVLTDSFVSVGSQNITNRGQSNKEATVASTEVKMITAIKSDIKLWLDSAVPITLDAIELMEKSIGPFRRKWKRLKKELNELDQQVSACVKQRLVEREKEKQAELARKIYKRSSGMRSNLTETRYSAALNVTLRNIEWEDKYSFANGVTNTMQLSNPRNADMRKWDIEGEKFNLDKGDPLLIALEDTGRLAFVIVKKVQTADFSFNGRFNEKLTAFGREWFVALKFAEEASDLALWNVEFTFSDGGEVLHEQNGGTRVVVRCYFDLMALRVVEVSSAGRGQLTDDFEKALRKGNPGILDRLRSYLLDARKFGWRVWIKRPRHFFEELGIRFSLRLRRLKTSLFLTVELANSYD